MQGGEGIKGGNWEICNSIINKIYLKINKNKNILKMAKNTNLSTIESKKQTKQTRRTGTESWIWRPAGWLPDGSGLWEKA